MQIGRHSFSSPLIAFSSPTFIPHSSCFRSYRLSAITITVLLYFSPLLSPSFFSLHLSLRKQMCSPYDLFILGQRLGLTASCCRQNALCLSSNGCVCLIFLPSFLMQMSLPPSPFFSIFQLIKNVIIVHSRYFFHFYWPCF